MRGDPLTIKPKSKPRTKKKVVTMIDDASSQFSPPPVELTEAERLNREMHYFKGLTVLTATMLFFIFVAFGALFSAMYLETRLTQETFVKIYNGLLPPATQTATTVTPTSTDETPAPTTPPPAEQIPVLVGNTYEKYGFKTFYPENWSYTANPFINYAKRVDFFADGQVHDVNKLQTGDFYIKVSNQDFSLDQFLTSGEKVTVSGYEGEIYNSRTSLAPDEASPIVVKVKVNDAKYFEINFVSAAGQEIMKNVLNQLVITP